MALFDIGVGRERAEAATGEDHIAGLHVVSGVAQFIHHACGKRWALRVGMNGHNGVDFAHVPVQIAMDCVCVNGLPIAGRHPLKVRSDLNRLGIYDHGVLAETVDDLVDLLSFLRSAVAHRVAGVHNPGIWMGDQFIKGLGGFAHGDDIVGHSHVPSPVFGETNLLIHPGEDVVQSMVSLFESDKERDRPLEESRVLV